MKTRILLSAASAIALLAGPAMGAGDMQPRSQTGSQAEFNAAQPNQFRAETLIGKEVRNMQGEQIGEVASVVINNQGEAQGVVLDVGGYLGMGERNVAVPWNDLRFNQSGEEIRLNLSKEQLENATAYNLNEENRGKAFQDDKFPEKTVGGRTQGDINKPPYDRESPHSGQSQ